MPVYLAPYVGRGTDADPFRPRATDGVEGWTGIDRRPDSRHPAGLAFLSSPVPLRDPHLDELGERDERSPAVRRILNRRFGLALSGPTLLTHVLDVMLEHGARLGGRLRPDAWGGYEIHLGGLWWRLRPIAGGVSYAETFNTGDTATLGPVLTWGETVPSLSVVGNACSIVPGGTGGEERAEHDTAGVDVYAQFVHSTFSTPSFGGMTATIAFRFAGAARTYYGNRIAISTVPAITVSLHKRVAAALTVIAGPIAGTYVAGDVRRGTAVGTTVTGLRNGASEQAVTDAAVDGVTVGGRRAGINMSVTNTTEVVLNIVDSFEFGDVGGTFNPAWASGANSLIGAGRIG